MLSEYKNKMFPSNNHTSSLKTCSVKMFHLKSLQYMRIKKRSVKMCSFKFNGEIKSSNQHQKFNIKMKEEQTYV